MKRILIPIAAFLFILLSCSKETVNEEKSLMLKSLKNPVERPIHAEFMLTTDQSQGAIQCLPTTANFFLGKGGNISGWADHFGNVQPEKSTSVSQSCWFSDATHLNLNNSGIITAANGDNISYTAVSQTNLVTGAFSGTVTITGGTGRFTDATGQVAMNGLVNLSTGITTWTGDGTITY